MPALKKSTILFDLTHNEMLNIHEKDFAVLSNLLGRLNVKTINNDTKGISKKILQEADILILGNPINEYFSNLEIKEILQFVRTGGGLLIISEYGGDYIQRTNLNDISKNFGIFFEKNILKERNKINQNCTSIISVQNLLDHRITNQIREIILGGACSLTINKISHPLVLSNRESWTEKYQDHSKKWEKDEFDKLQTLCACCEYGKGKVVALGDMDILSDDNNIGLNVLDNRKFVLNILNWLIEPTKDEDVTLWTLDQIGTLQNEIKELNQKVGNIIESISFLNKRIAAIESNAETSQTDVESTLKEKKTSYI